MLQSYNIRNDKKFLRNNYEMSGLWEIPHIRRQEIDLSNIKLLACSHTRLNEDEQHRQYGVHFYVDDPKFSGIYNYPERTLQKYAQYRFLLTPDFSLYSEMPMWLQIANVAKNRWCGAYWQDNGLTVIPTISWSSSQSYGFCFDGIEQNTIVSVGMIGCKGNKLGFLRGYDKMMEKLNPQAIICYGKPFEEMQGNIIYVPFAHTRKEA
ncbi:MAG: DUF4417 domain-containing protein [Alphaproteobacteria bacterium]|nr:DUF4417 domain-containing protein [Alphaproteobacteria bacterium]